MHPATATPTSDFSLCRRAPERRPTRRAGSAPGLVAGATAALALLGSAHAAEVFAPNIPDFFQHQRWGVDGTNPDAYADSDWEKDGGWCYQASMLNTFYFFEKKGGFDSILPDAITGAGWRAAFTTELPAIIDEQESLPAPDLDGNGMPDGHRIWNDAYHRILQKRGVGPEKGVKKGLIRMEFLQVGGDVEYSSSAGGKKKISTTSLFRVAQSALRNRDAINLFLTKTTATTQLWWSGPDVAQGAFHVVSLVGYDDAAKKIWFADPDSNPDPTGADPDPGAAGGNTNANAGWIVPRDSDPTTNPTKKRRFSANASLPVPDTTNADERTRRLFEVKLKDDLRTFDASAAASNRYDGVYLLKLVGLHVVSAHIKTGLPVQGEPVKQFEIAGGGEGALPFDLIWVFPTDRSFVELEPDTQTLVTFNRPGWSVVDVLLPGELDDWGNVREFGGFVAQGPEVLDVETLEFTYETSDGLELDGWDVLIDHMADPEQNALRVQAYGGDIEQIFDQVGPPCAADFNRDGAVDGADLGVLLASWGGTDPAIDIDQDGVIDGADLGLVLAAWGPCGK